MGAVAAYISQRALRPLPALVFCDVIKTSHARPDEENDLFFINIVTERDHRGNAAAAINTRNTLNKCYALKLLKINK